MVTEESTKETVKTFPCSLFDWGTRTMQTSRECCGELAKPCLLFEMNSRALIERDRATPSIVITRACG